ncbi:uncharacterized protein LOC122647215 [Telopea speciosissima]|uniref:uncharacterized protein LOC122647215 n=1 Tax=Telopea speciosissima TaxID=54955 RepID=UPI001CC512BE|nr:uncharacterized protein LOC122647215 [Telopea speciosissima]
MAKLNIDGASKGNLGLSGRGGIIEDSEGKMIAAFLNFYRICTNVVAKMRVLLDGLRLCAELGFNGCHDVLALVDSLGVNLYFSFWESNRAADFLANLACSRTSNSSFQCGQNVPQELSRILHEDKDGLPIFRM